MVLSYWGKEERISSNSKLGLNIVVLLLGENW